MCRCKVGDCTKCSCVKNFFFCLNKCKCSNKCVSKPPLYVETENNKYYIDQFIGSGTFGIVFSIKDIDLVCKISFSRVKIQKEYEFYKLLYPNLHIELIKKSTKKFYGFIMNKMDPFNYENLSKDAKKKYLCDLIDILQNFHKSGYCHADIKPDNIMFYQNNIYLIDLNLTTPVGSKYDYVYGNYAYCSPRTQELKEFIPFDDFISILFLTYKIIGNNKLKWGNTSELKIKNKCNILKEQFSGINEENYSIELIKQIINSYN